MNRVRLVVALAVVAALAGLAPAADATEACGLGGVVTCWILGPASPRPPKSVGASATVQPASGGLGTTFTVSMRDFTGSEYVSMWLYPPKGQPSDLTGNYASGGRISRTWNASYTATGTYRLCGQGQGSLRVACATFSVAGYGTAPAAKPVPMIGTGAKPPSKLSNGMSTLIAKQTVAVGADLHIGIGWFAKKEIVNVLLSIDHGPVTVLGQQRADKDGFVEGYRTTDRTGFWEICVQGTKTRRAGCVTSWVVPAAFANGTPTGTNGAVLGIVSKNLSATTVSAGGFTPGESIQLWLGAGPGVTDQTWRAASPVTADGAGNATFAAQWYYEDPAGPFAGCLVGATSGFAACSTSIPRGTSILDS